MFQLIHKPVVHCIESYSRQLDAFARTNIISWSHIEG